MQTFEISFMHSKHKQNPQMLTNNDLEGVYWLIHV